MNFHSRIYAEYSKNWKYIAQVKVTALLKTIDKNYVFISLFYNTKIL
jgi:hypothetical protein